MMINPTEISGRNTRKTVVKPALELRFHKTQWVALSFLSLDDLSVDGTVFPSIHIQYEAI